MGKICPRDLGGETKPRSGSAHWAMTFRQPWVGPPALPSRVGSPYFHFQFSVFFASFLRLTSRIV